MERSLHSVLEKVLPAHVPSDPAKVHHIVRPTGAHTHTIILLHDQGSSSEEFARDFFGCSVKTFEGSKELKTFREALPGGVKWIFPSASRRYSNTLQEDIIQWFDMHPLNNPLPNMGKTAVELSGLSSSIPVICDLICIERQLVSTQRIFLGGIGQGAATAMLAMIAQNFTLGGFIGLRGWLPLGDTLMADSVKIYCNDNQATVCTEAPKFVSPQGDLLVRNSCSPVL